jgi:hypothetical protein
MIIAHSTVKTSATNSYFFFFWNFQERVKTSISIDIGFETLLWCINSLLQ